MKYRGLAWMGGWALCALGGLGACSDNLSGQDAAADGALADGSASADGGGSGSTGSGSGGSTTAGSSGGTGTSDDDAGGSSSSSTGVVPTYNADGTCDVVTLKADRLAPKLLIVLDRSGSMETNASNTDRWAGSVEAVDTVVSELEDLIQFGLMTFPHALIGSSGGVNGECSPGELDEPMALFNAKPIADTLSGLISAGGTPTAQTLAVVSDVMAKTDADLTGSGEFLQSEKYVMLVTDGDPNCFTFSDDPDPEAQQASIRAVAKLRREGVRTYVIGFQTAQTSFASVLDEMATRGGTGDRAHRSVESGDELLEELRGIAGDAVSCSFVLASEVSEDRVEVSVDGVDASYGSDWDLLDDGHTIELLGDACTALRSGVQVEARVLCEPVRIL